LPLFSSRHNYGIRSKVSNVISGDIQSIYKSGREQKLKAFLAHSEYSDFSPVNPKKGKGELFCGYSSGRMFSPMVVRRQIAYRIVLKCPL
jgi:hypothetical protein